MLANVKKEEINNIYLSNTEKARKNKKYKIKFIQKNLNVLI